MIRRLAVGLLALVLLLAAVLVANTLRQGSRQLAVPPLSPLAVDEAGVVQTMAAAVRARTVSGLLDPVLQVVLVPGAVRALEAHEPVVGPLGLGHAAAGGERHGRLDVVPRVGVAAGHPRHHARGQLPLGDGVDGGLHLR